MALAARIDPQLHPTATAQEFDLYGEDFRRKEFNAPCGAVRMGHKRRDRHDAAARRTLHHGTREIGGDGQSFPADRTEKVNVRHW
jgi:hypothetical protein